METQTSTIIIFLIELIAVILATIHYKKYKNTTEKYFLPYLWYVIFTEVCGYYLNDYLKVSNIWLMNTYIIVTFSFFLWWYYSIVKSTKHKKIIVFVSILFIIIAVYDSIYNGWSYYLNLTFAAGASGILISTLTYFSELLNSDEVLKLKSNLRFWIATGMLLFSIGMIPFIFFSRVLFESSNLRSIILMALNIILYGCFSIGFIWNKTHQ